MSIYVARQPIFDRNMKVFAYELLYRSGMSNSFSNADEDMATTHVLLNSFYNIGLDKLTYGKTAFVNFTANLLKQDIATLFPNTALVVEVLENVCPEDEIVNRCKELKKSGYKIALDDFVLRDDYEPLINIADIIKVDFQLTDLSERKTIVDRYSNKKIEFLAEKVETQKEYIDAKSMGYTYFQGYFFSKPTIMSGRPVSGAKASRLKLIERVNSQYFDFDEIAELVAHDVSLTYKLLKLVNSAAFGFRNKVESVRKALIILGTKEIRKLVSLLALQEMGQDKPDEILTISLTRAKFAELLAENSDLKERKEECYLMGLLSMLSVMLDKPVDEALEDIPISSDIVNALVRQEDKLGDLYNMIIHQEQGSWKMDAYAEAICMDKGMITECYIKALDYTRSMLYS